jgi:hypothetical protein
MVRRQGESFKVIVFQRRPVSIETTSFMLYLYFISVAVLKLARMKLLLLAESGRVYFYSNLCLIGVSKEKIMIL